MSNGEYTDPERLDVQSASQLEIVVQCPGMINLRNSIPKEKLQQARSKEDDEWAQKGDRIHKAFETGNTLMLSTEEHKTYSTAVKYQDAIVQKWIADKALDPTKIQEGQRELRFYLHSPHNPLEVIGSAMLDRHWFYNDCARHLALVTDLKSGWNPKLPTSARSWQLKEQLICLWREYDGLTEGRVAYVKAKDKHEFGDFCDYNQQDLKFSWDSIVFHSWMSTQPDAPRRAGPHCRWCACKAHCKEAIAMALLPSTMASVKKEGRKVVADVNGVTLEDLHKLWQYRTAITKILEAGIDRLKAMSDEDLAKVGLTHGKGREGMKWTDAAGVFYFLMREGWTEADVWSAVDINFGKLVELAQKQKAVDEESARAIMKEDLAPYYTVTEGERGIKQLR